jgi:hypothetical protein
MQGGGKRFNGHFHEQDKMPTGDRYRRTGLKGEAENYKGHGRNARSVQFLPTTETMSYSNKLRKPKQPGVDSGISDWPPDMEPSVPQRGEADQPLRPRNPQYKEDLIPNARKQVSSGDALRPAVRPPGYSNHSFERDYVAKNPKRSDGDLLKSRAPWW